MRISSKIWKIQFEEQKIIYKNKCLQKKLIFFTASKRAKIKIYVIFWLTFMVKIKNSRYRWKNSSESRKYIFTFPNYSSTFLEFQTSLIYCHKFSADVSVDLHKSCEKYQTFCMNLFVEKFTFQKLFFFIFTKEMPSSKMEKLNFPHQLHNLPNFQLNTIQLNIYKEKVLHLWNFT